MSPVNPASGLLGDSSRDEYLTDFGKATLSDRYLFTGETYQDLFVRVAQTYADDEHHAARLYDYMSKGWFMPATPILSNGGLERGLPISCFLNTVGDSLASISETWNENVWLAAKGGGIGTHWGGVRSISEKIKGAGQTSGIIPFIKVQDSMTLAVSQGSLRRGSAAVYLDIDHPEIEEYLRIRRATGGDVNRQCQNVHQGVVLTDKFMEAVASGSDFHLTSRLDGSVIKTVSARKLFADILEMRLETGEPYVLFIDTVNRSVPEVYAKNGLKVRQSNLCSEIMLHTGPDQFGKERTAVCCLSSANLEAFPEWSQDPMFVEDVMRMLDNVLQDFIDRSEGLPGFERARYSAMRERSVGLGAMGFHSFLQKNGIPFESVMAKVWNKKFFSHLRAQADAASVKLAQERGPCPDAADVGLMERFSHKLAIAPTSSISIICKSVSAGVEPIITNIYTHKTLSGSFTVKNRYLQELLVSKGLDDHETWVSILEQEGSVQHLDFLTQDEKDVFKTAFEIDQRWVIDHAADRSSDIDQGQSVNIFILPTIDKGELSKLHSRAWRGGVKSLYYVRSVSESRSEKISAGLAQTSTPPVSSDDECLSCQ